MFVDSRPQICPRCLRPTVRATYRARRRWVHTSTWQPQCDAPSASAASAPFPAGAPVLAAA